MREEPFWPISNFINLFKFTEVVVAIVCIAVEALVGWFIGLAGSIADAGIGKMAHT